MPDRRPLRWPHPQVHLLTPIQAGVREAPRDEIALCRMRYSAIYAEGRTMPYRDVFPGIHSVRYSTDSAYLVCASPLNPRTDDDCRRVLGQELTVSHTS